MITAEHTEVVLAARLGGAPGRWEQRLLRETPGLRRVTACSLHRVRPEEHVEVVAKAYATEEGARTARTMSALRRALDRRPGPVSAVVPRPLLYDAGHRLLVQELAPGMPCGRLLTRPDARAHLAATGAALAVLHGLPVDLGRARRLQDNLVELVRPHPHQLAERVPETAGRVRALLAELEARERSSGPVPPAPAHRDLHLGQVLRDGERTWVLDWDRAATADPALDLGTLLAALATEVPRRRAAALGQALLDGYAGGDTTGAVARAPLYEAFAFLRLACERHRLQAAGWRQDLDDLLARAARALGT